MLAWKKIIRPFYFPAIVLAFHLIIVYLGVYVNYSWIDVPMHFLGGFAIAFTVLRIFSYLSKVGAVEKMNFLTYFIFVVSLVCVAAVFWEFSEFILGRILRVSLQLSLEDTLLDLAMGLIGGIVGFFVFYPKEN